MKTLILIFLITLTSFAQQMRFTGNEISIGNGMSFSGTFIESTAGDTLYWGQVTYLYSAENKMYLADEAVDSTLGSLQFVCLDDTLLMGKIGRFLYSGFISDTSQSYTPGTDVCIDNGGVAEAACDQTLGMSIDTNTVAFFANDIRATDGKQGDFITTGQLRQGTTWHVYGGFQDSSITVDVQADAWTEITNATNNLWVGVEADGFSLSGDTMIVANTGDYAGTVGVTLSALQGKDYDFRIYNVTQDAQVGFSAGVTTTGVNNYAQMTLPIYLEATASDSLVLQVYGSTDGTDITLTHGIFFLTYLHD